jgi:hypothetical protein
MPNKSQPGSGGIHEVAAENRSHGQGEAQVTTGRLEMERLRRRS